MLRAVFSVAKHLNLGHRKYPISSDWNNQADRTQWRELLRMFGNVKILHIRYRLIGQLSRSLQPGEGESPVDLLPELEKISYFASEPMDDAFAPYIKARQKAGRPVTLVYHRDEDNFFW